MTKLLPLYCIPAAVLLAVQLNGEPESPDVATGEPRPVHATSAFHFSANLPYRDAFPLFGAWKEQLWDPDWKPRFVYPVPPADREGAVFTVNHDSRSSVWMLTRFDREAGRVQYTVSMDERIMTRIDITLKPDGSERTSVAVVYEWTALDPAADEHVRTLAKRHENAAAEWSGQINAYAARVQAK